MPDCSAAMITIGGKIKTIDAAYDLLSALENEGSLDWQMCSPAAGWWNHLLSLAQAGKQLVLSYSEAPYGEFPELEAVCRRNKLHFHRADDGHYAYPPSNVMFHPERGFGEFGGTIDEGPCIALDTLLKWEGEGVLQEKISWLKDLTRVPPLGIARKVVDAMKEADDA